MYVIYVEVQLYQCNVQHNFWAVVVAQLVDGSLPIPEVRSSNPVIDKLLY